MAERIGRTRQLNGLIDRSSPLSLPSPYHRPYSLPASSSPLPPALTETLTTALNSPWATTSPVGREVARRQKHRRRLLTSLRRLSFLPHPPLLTTPPTRNRPVPSATVGRSPCTNIPPLPLPAARGQASSNPLTVALRTCRFQRPSRLQLSGMMW